MDFLNPLAIHFNHESITNVVIMIWPVRIKESHVGLNLWKKNFGTDWFWNFDFDGGGFLRFWI